SAKYWHILCLRRTSQHCTLRFDAVLKAKTGQKARQTWRFRKTASTHKPLKIKKLPTLGAA
ncbi:hypothetical protein, partial [Undibacterium luofuense]